MFGDRDLQCSYFPNDRVLADIRKKEISYSGQVECVNTCMSADTLFYANVFNNSEVDFGYSSRGVSEGCKNYKLDYTDDRGTHTFIVMNCDSTAVVKSWTLPEGVSCDCPIE